MTPLLPIEYESNDEYYDKDEDTDTPTQQRQRVIHPESMSPTVSNVYNIHPRKQTDYVKEKINELMAFAEVGNGLNKYAL